MTSPLVSLLSRFRFTKILLRALSRWIAYTSFFILCFILFAYWTFPWNYVEDTLVEKVSMVGYELNIADLSPSRLTGVQLKGVRVAVPNRIGRDKPLKKDSSTLPTELFIDELTVRVRVLAWLAGRTALNFNAKLAGGKIGGSFDSASQNAMMRFAINIKNINLTQLPILRQYTKVPLNGITSGDITLSLPKNIQKSTGHIYLKVSNLSIGKGETPIDIPGWGELTISEIHAGEFNFDADIKQGTLEINRAEADGSDITFRIAGNIQMEKPLRQSQLDIMLRLKIKEAYSKKNPTITAAQELAKHQPMFKDAQTQNGFLQYNFNGPPVPGLFRLTPAGQSKFGVSH